MRYYLDLYFTGWQLFLRTLTQYRADFMIMGITAIMHDGAGLLFVGVIFSNVQQIQGWTFPEVLMIFGLMVTVRSLWGSFLDVPHGVQWYVQGGGLDGLLVRPPAVLFQLIIQRGINPAAFGRIFVGGAALITALLQTELQWAWWWVLYLPLVIVSGVLMMFSTYLMIACLSFWFTNINSALTTVTWSAYLGQFPVTIYAVPLQFLLTWVLPFAMMGFYPAAFLLRGDEYRIYGLLAPLMGLVFLGLALAVWRFSLRRYQSTGS